MRDRVARLAVGHVVVYLFALSGCSPPNQWRVFHAAGPNQGSISLATKDALIARWSVPVGEVGFGSPVIGNDGKVYVGTLAGELVAVNPNGSIAWKQLLAADSAILGSPAVDLEGNVYAVAAGNHTGSTLFKLDPSGNPICQVQMPGAVSSSPKTWGVDQDLFVALLTANARLRVFNRRCALVEELEVCGLTVVGGGGVTRPNPDYQPPPRPDPTVAVIESKDFPGAPLLIVPSRHCLNAYRWSGAHLSTAWSTTFDDDHVFTSPAALDMGNVMVGFDDGHVRAYDVTNGFLQWDYDTRENVVGTPAGVLFNAYVVSETAIAELHASFGNELAKQGLPYPTYSSPAVTLNRLYLSTNTGLRTYPLDLVWEASSPQGAHSQSSPTIGPDGTIYIVSAGRQLIAYPDRDR